MKVEVEVFRVAEGSTEVTRREKFVVEVNGTPGVRTWCSEIQHAARERFGIPLEAQHVTTPRLVLFSLIYPCHYGIGSIRLKLMSDEERITEYAKFFDEKKNGGMDQVRDWQIVAESRRPFEKATASTCGHPTSGPFQRSGQLLSARQAAFNCKRASQARSPSPRKRRVEL